MFCRYCLSTSDVVAARTFYSEALGLALPESGASDSSALEAWPLHERARAAGAPPHWLGHIAVQDLKPTVDRMVQQGSEPLGPVVQARDGTPFATMRDPCGAVVAVRGGSEQQQAAPVAWHLLNTHDVEQSWALYSGLFGWSPGEPRDLVETLGKHRLFAWHEGGASVGAMASTERHPGIHPHWLYFFPVGDIEAVAACVRRLGGTAGALVTLPDGSQISGCEDPQGAAFGVMRLLPSAV